MSCLPCRGSSHPPCSGHAVAAKHSLRLLQTLRYLTAKQLVYLLRYRLARPHAPKPLGALPARRWSSQWSAPRWRHAARQADGSFKFFGRSAFVHRAADWDRPEQNRLWRYNLHYLDDLVALDDTPLSHEARGSLLDQWIAQNPPAHGSGWEPFPLSLRIVNIVKFINAQSDGRSDWIDSLALQTQALARRVEHHIRANHVFENGKALVFAGAFFEGPSAQTWLDAGLKILDAECLEQFLPDGGHFELSPMYHGTMLWNLCDLILLADACALPALIERRPLWRELLSRGLEWYAAMTHPDGGIAFFNDSAFGIAPDLDTVERFSKVVGVTPKTRLQSERLPSYLHLSSSGYLRIDLGPESVAIVDVARVNPDYQPGHTHADVLSFELSLFGQRVLVNSGTSTYERSTERDAQRGTAAHNTVIIDDLNSSDTWAGFRVGRRAKPKLIGIETKDGQIVIRASHDGYHRLIEKTTHLRQWTCDATSVAVLDRIAGPFRRAAAHYHLHPDVEAQFDESDPGCVHLTLANDRTVSISVLQGRLSLEPSTWHPEFGSSVASQRLRVDFLTATIETRICWQSPK